MNLRSFADAVSPTRRNRIIKAGGPGSGCHGENCGRPEGHGGRHIPEGGKKSFIEQRHDDKIKEKTFRRERRRINKAVKNYKYTGGQMTRKTVKELKKQGQIVDMKSPGLKLKTDISRVIDTRTEKVRVEQTNKAGEPNGKFKTYRVEVETVKRVGGIETPRMGKTRGRNVPEGPPEKAHSLKGQFTESMRTRTPELNLLSVGFDAHHPGGAGATVIVHKYSEGPNKSRVLINEVRRGDDARIEETRKYTFGSGKAAKEYLGQRYGIKKFNWSGK